MILAHTNTHLCHRGSKIVIEGENLDSVYRTFIRFKPNESHLKPVTRVKC